jgi:hypothetical protein
MDTGASGLASEVRRLTAWREAFERSNAAQWRQRQDEHAAQIKRMQVHVNSRTHVLIKRIRGFRDAMYH